MREKLIKLARKVPDSPSPMLESTTWYSPRTSPAPGRPGASRHLRRGDAPRQGPCHRGGWSRYRLLVTREIRVLCRIRRSSWRLKSDEDFGDGPCDPSRHRDRRRPDREPEDGSEPGSRRSGLGHRDGLGRGQSDRSGVWPLHERHNLADYHVAVNADIPRSTSIFVAEEDQVVNPLGAKGLGEIGIVSVAPGDRQCRLPCDRKTRSGIADHLDKVAVEAGDGMKGRRSENRRAGMAFLGPSLPRNGSVSKF